MREAEQREKDVRQILDTYVGVEERAEKAEARVKELEQERRFTQAREIPELPANHPFNK